MFEIRSKNTYEEFMRAMQSIAAARSALLGAPSGRRPGILILLIASIVIEGVCLWFATVGKSEFFSAFSIFLGMLMVMYAWMLINAKNRQKNAFMTKQAQKEMFAIWDSDKQMRDCEETIRFDENGFEVIRSFGSFKVGYDCVFRLIETKTNLYIMLSMNRYCNVNKESVTKEQYDHIRTHCCPDGDKLITL